MPDKLYGGLPEDKFRTIAKNAVKDYWNSNKTLTKKYGEITNRKIYIVWQVKVIQNHKALLGVSMEGDGMYFEFTWNGDAQEGYLDIYKKQKHLTIN